ncbi:MAG: lipocalin-like domain-containing protein [Candidatus Melainabacteria bacterium]|nr:lipocalin-like domain-containing protein [Candidatus Melainabacteria bacterium]
MSGTMRRFFISTPFFISIPLLACRMVLLLLLACGLLMGQHAFSQNAPTEAFRAALPGYVYRFPQDHAAHPAFKTEWWYYTGHLQATDGRWFGYELTFFRSGVNRNEAQQKLIPLTWRLTDVYPAHAALTDIAGRRFLFTEKLNRSSPYVAGARTDRYHVWNEDWSVTRLPDGRHRLEATIPASTAASSKRPAKLSLWLNPTKPPAIHGRNGVSQKADCVGCASHYYSITRLQSTGTLTLDGKTLPVRGTSWMDHEFGSNQLTAQQIGWDWYSIQLSDGRELMFYSLRRKDGRIEPQSSGSWVDARGNVHHLPLAAFRVRPTGYWKSPRSGGRYPMGWQLSVTLAPAQTLVLTLKPTLTNQELVIGHGKGLTYWEGSCTVTGQWQQAQAGDVHPVSGRAYVEMTGYAQAFRQKI